MKAHRKNYKGSSEGGCHLNITKGETEVASLQTPGLFPIRKVCESAKGNLQQP